MHLENNEFAALADGELPPTRVAEANRHLAQCAECAGRVEDFKRTYRHVAQLLCALDNPVPRVSAQTVVTRATRRPLRLRRATAAGIAVLLVAGGAAAAVPGSPMRRYLDAVLASGQSRSPRKQSVAARSNSETGNALSGVAFIPSGGVDIVFRDAQRVGAMHITLSDAVALRISHDGGHAAYALTDSGVVVENGSSTANYQVVIPRAASSARVHVGDQIVFAKDGARITSDAARDSSGTYVIQFSQLNRSKQ